MTERVSGSRFDSSRTTSTPSSSGGRPGSIKSTIAMSGPHRDARSTASSQLPAVSTTFSPGVVSRRLANAVRTNSSSSTTSSRMRLRGIAAGRHDDPEAESAARSGDDGRDPADLFRPLPDAGEAVTRDHRAGAGPVIADLHHRRVALLSKTHGAGTGAGGVPRDVGESLPHGPPEGAVPVAGRGAIDNEPDSDRSEHLGTSGQLGSHTGEARHDGRTQAVYYGPHAVDRPPDIVLRLPDLGQCHLRSRCGRGWGTGPGKDAALGGL